MQDAHAGFEQKVGDFHKEHMDKHDSHAGSFDKLHAEHHGRHDENESKIVRLQEQIARLEGHVNVTEQSSFSKIDQLKELVDETTLQTTANLLRVRNDTEGATREALRASREELREDLRTVRDEQSKDLQILREDFRSNLNGCRELLQTAQQESSGGLGELKGEFRTLSRDVCGKSE